MMTSLSLGVYLLIGLFYAHCKYNEIISDFEKEVDEDDPNEKEYLEVRNDLYDHMHSAYKLLGEQGLKAVIYLFFMIFWLPIVIYLEARHINNKDIS